MTENLNLLFFYLELEEINLDKIDFEFQIQSHPNYPSILSIVDTLSFFNIENVVLKYNFADIDELPIRFMTVLVNDKTNSELYLIEKKDSNYFYFKGNRLVKIPVSELEKNWKSIVLLVDKSNFDSNVVHSKRSNNWILLSILTIVLLFQLLISKEIIFLKFFLLLPLIGVLFSIAVLKDFFEINSKMINSICTISSYTSCSSIVKSKKWKFFDYFNFSDLSITFFCSQFVLILFSIFFNQGFELLYFQKIVLYFCIPFLFLSIYYQKFVEKKWCPICLCIIAIIVVEIIALQFLPQISFNFPNQIIFFALIFLSFYMLWKQIKRLLIDKKDLKEKQLKLIRFERIYELFKAKLLTENKIILPTNSVVLGSENAKKSIGIISNPFCGHCKDVHFMLDRILEKNKEDVNVKVILRTNLETLDEDSKKLFRTLLGLFYNNGEECFKEALKDWFENLNIKDWLGKYYIENDFTKFDETLKSHFNWANQTGYTYTPAIFINGYQYPQIYDRKNLEFFINDIIEDEDLN